MLLFHVREMINIYCNLFVVAVSNIKIPNSIQSVLILKIWIGCSCEADLYTPAYIPIKKISLQILFTSRKIHKEYASL